MKKNIYSKSLYVVFSAVLFLSACMQSHNMSPYPPNARDTCNIFYFKYREEEQKAKDAWLYVNTPFFHSIFIEEYILARQKMERIRIEAQNKGCLIEISEWEEKIIPPH